MKIAIIGTGYVGLPSGVGFAELGHTVTCIDNDQDKITSLKQGKLTLFEKGLEEIFNRHRLSGRLSFTSSMAEGVSGADVVIIAVGTPPHPKTNEADLSYIFAAASELAPLLDSYKVVAVKSTVPIGTGDQVENIIAEVNPSARCDVISLPEFLREGLALHDFFNPDRIVAGTDSEKAREVVKAMYQGMVSDDKLLFVRRRSSEAIKYVSNAFLAVKIHYINEIADLCEQVGANIAEVARGVGMDSRIGSKFLNSGPGFGGSCFPKDTMALSFMAHANSVNLTLVDATINGNFLRKKKMANRILHLVKGVRRPNVAVLGLAFKQDTDDCRESPAIDIVKELLTKTNGFINITAYDPKAMHTADKLLGDQIKYAPDMYSAVKGADVIAVLTEWDEFRTLDLARAADLVNHRNIMDCRNLLNKDQAEKSGFTYHCIGS